MLVVIDLSRMIGERKIGQIAHCRHCRWKWCLQGFSSVIILYILCYWFWKYAIWFLKGAIQSCATGTRLWMYPFEPSGRSCRLRFPLVGFQTDHCFAHWSLMQCEWTESICRMQSPQSLFKAPRIAPSEGIKKWKCCADLWKKPENSEMFDWMWYYGEFLLKIWRPKEISMLFWVVLNLIRFFGGISAWKHRGWLGLPVDQASGPNVKMRRTLRT